MIRRILTLTGLSIALAVALSGATFYYVLFTQSGLRFIAAHLPRRFGSVHLTVEGVSGTLATGVHVRRIIFDQRRVHLRLYGVYSRVLLSPLYWRTVETPDTSIDSAYIEVKRVRELPRGPPHFLPWWLVIRIDRGHVGRAVVVLPDGRRLEGSDIDGAARLSHRDIRFYHVALRMGDMHYAGAGTLHAVRPLALTAHGQIIWQAPRQPRWLIAASLAGDLGKLKLGAKVTEPCRVDFHGFAFDLTHRWHWRGEAGVHDLDLRAWHRSAVLGLISAQLALSGDARGFSAGGTADPTGLHAGRFHVQLDGRLQDNHSKRVLTARRLAITHIASGAHLDASGSLRFGSGGHGLALRGRWSDLRWPLVGKAAFHSPSGTFTLSGGWPVTLIASGVGSIRGLRLASSSIEATLGSKGLTVDKARLGMLDGQVRARAQLSWLPPKHWTFRAFAQGLDPGRLRPVLRGRLGFTLSASGDGFRADSPFTVQLGDLHGRLRGLPASGGGGLTHSDRTWTFDRVRVSLGGVRVALDGRVARRQTHMQFAVAGDLRALAAADRGRVQAAGTVDGPSAALAVRAWAQGSGVKVGKLQIADFHAKVDFDPTSHRRSALAFNVHRLQFHRRLLRSFDLTVQGPASDLEAHLAAGAPGLLVQAKARGSLYGGVFAGQLTALRVTGAQALDLHLRKAVPFTLSRAHSALEGLCLSGTPGGLCAGGNWTPAAWSAYLTANALPLATLTAGLTPAVEYQGTIGAQARLEGGGGAPVRGTLRASLAHAVLSRRLVSGRIDRTPIGSGLVSIVALPRSIHAQASLTAGAIGTFNATVDARRVAADWRNMPIQGKVHAQTSKLDLVSIYLPGVDQVSGNLVANAEIAGTLADPRLTGLVSVSNGTADLYRTNLRVRDAALSARLTDGGLDFDGSGRVGRGTLHATGRMRWRGMLPYGNLHLTGNDLRVVDTPEAQIDASPDLNFAVAARRIKVSGTVFIPHASIHPRSLTGAVRVSSDQIIVGQESSAAAHRYQVMSTITLGLGNDVNIDTMGLTGKLTGALTVRSGYGVGTRATGGLMIEQGQYAAYARKLDIQYGRLLFRGGLLDNPGIEIRAVKSYPDVTAGINVSGTLRQPQVSFFSNPSLSQSQIMSLIFSGGGGSLQTLQAGTTAQTQQTTAAGELLAQGGALLAQQLGHRIGLPAFSLRTDLNNVTSLVLGKYLSPRLYVSYGVGLTQQLNEIRLRYSIGRHWTIRVLAGQGKGAGQSKSGQMGGADLVFSVVK